MATLPSFGRLDLDDWRYEASLASVILYGTGDPSRAHAGGLWTHYTSPDRGEYALAELEIRDDPPLPAPDPNAATAWRAAAALGDFTYPNDPAAEDPIPEPYLGMTTVVNTYLRRAARAWADWSTVAWTIDGRATEARIFSFAGAWAAFALEGRNAVIVMAAHDRDPRVALRTRPESVVAEDLADIQRDALGFDVRIRAAAQPLRRPNGRRWHADYLAARADPT